jgi:hypothetical protein
MSDGSRPYRSHDGDCTRCGNEKRDHHKPTKRDPTHCYVRVGGHENADGFIFDDAPCPCSGYTVAVLPEGERLEFGKHRLEQEEAETAPAWPPLP